MVKVAVLGYGTVGSGVVEVLDINKDSIAKKAGKQIEVKYILDLREFPGDKFEELIVHDFNVILNDPEIDIVAEAMGGTKVAYDFAKKSLQAGKNYCTSNKELVALHGAELMELAKQNKKNFLFEASVGGGIPIIRPLSHSLTADDIDEIEGILNGTTNFILTKMSEEGLPFDVVLKEAQDLGYAEANPEADVEGYDACRKIAILSSLAYGNTVDFEDIYTEGITKITDIDFKYAKKMNMAIKLLGKSNKIGDKIYAMVAPFMIDETNPLYFVKDVKNGILARGDVYGDIMFYGSGAGKLPTASAVVADIVEAAKHIDINIVTIWDKEKLQLEDKKSLKTKFFVRVKGNMSEQIEMIEKAFGKVMIIKVENVDSEFAFITESIEEGKFEENIKIINNVITRIRVQA